MSVICTIGDEVRVLVDEYDYQRIGFVRFIGQIQSRNGIQYGVKWKDISHRNQNLTYVKKENIIEVLRKETTLRVTVGDVVWIDKKNSRGIVRFIGRTSFGSNPESSIWYGVQLEKRKGKNDGCINGVRYFHCLPKYGLFVKAPQIRPPYHIDRDIYSNEQYDTTEIQIVMILQKWLRCCHGFSYDVGNKYHTISSVGIVKLIKKLTFQQRDTFSAATNLFFKLEDLDHWQRLFKLPIGASYQYYDDKKNWNAIELYLNHERRCKYINKGYMGTWQILEKEKKLQMKFKDKQKDKKSVVAEMCFDEKNLATTRVDIMYS